MRKVAIVTHTGSDLSPEEAKRLGVILVADYIRINDTEYRNKFDISDEDFYQQLEDKNVKLSTSQPSPDSYENAFIQAEAEGAEEILCLMVTSKMSGSYSTAVSYKYLMEEDISLPVTVFDTLQVSHGMGMLVREAARLADLGLSCQEIVKALEVFRNQVAVYFMLESFENARKGGRLGAIKLAIAEAIRIKPVLKFSEGQCRNYKNMRKVEDAYNHLVDLIEKEADPGREIIVFHGANLESRDLFCQMIRERIPKISIRTDYVGPVIGIYAGRKSLGVAYVRKDPS